MGVGVKVVEKGFGKLFGELVGKLVVVGGGLLLVFGLLGWTMNEAPLEVVVRGRGLGGGAEGEWMLMLIVPGPEGLEAVIVWVGRGLWWGFRGRGSFRPRAIVSIRSMFKSGMRKRSTLPELSLKMSFSRFISRVKDKTTFFNRVILWSPLIESIYLLNIKSFFRFKFLDLGYFLRNSWNFPWNRTGFGTNTTLGSISQPISFARYLGRSISHC